MRCLKCGSLDDKVIDSRASKDGAAIRRRRECLGCGNRFTTYEQIERDDFLVVKQNGARVSFSASKLFDGMVKACEKRPVSIEVLEQAAEEITNELYNLNLREVPTSLIGPLVMNQLERIDPVAYVRYASVYRQFQEVGQFIDEIHSLERRPGKDERQPEFFN